MKIHKYKGQTEKDAMILVKEELGGDALIVSVKHIRPKGVFRLFRKPFVEVTAAIDDRAVMADRHYPKIELNAEHVMKNNAMISANRMPNDGEDTASELDEFKRFIERFSSKQEKHVDIQKEMSRQSQPEVVYEPETQTIPIAEEYQEKPTAEPPALQLIYEQLLDNEVDEHYANELVSGLSEYMSEENHDIDDLISIVYKRIVKNLADYDTINIDEQHKYHFFIGPTGVGKTTTIAKIASYYTLNLNKKVALITADTYRIAAVEQLRTYANILSVPIKVIYSRDELIDAVRFFEDKDLILIDTAGRSHKNYEHQKELQDLLDSIEYKDVYLTLSVGTKYKDLMRIVDVYRDITDFKVIFTKLDETVSYGNILNIRKATGAKLSYVTFGQNVPDDISEINPHAIAKNLLGGDDNGSSK